MPSEKYSPLLLVLRVYFRPLSVLNHSRLAPTIGFPSRPLHPPFTVPVAWANTGGTHSAATTVTSTTISKPCFMFLASRHRKPISKVERPKLARPAPRMGWDLNCPLPGMPADEAHNYRISRRRCPRGCSTTTLNRRARPIQDPA